MIVVFRLVPTAAAAPSTLNGHLSNAHDTACLHAAHLQQQARECMRTAAFPHARVAGIALAPLAFCVLQGHTAHADASSMRYLELPGIAAAAAHAGAPGPAALKAHSATEERSARLHAWALATLQARSHSLSGGCSTSQRACCGRLAQTAADLCACPPVAVDLAHVHVLPMFEGWGDAPAAAVLSGSLVGLLRCDPSAPREAVLVRPTIACFPHRSTPATRTQPASQQDVHSSAR